MPHSRGTHARNEQSALEQEQSRVLYIESDENLRRSFTRSLVRRGLTVDAAATRGEALSLSDKKSYPVIVADLVLPETDGVSLVHELRSRQPDASFIITTGCDVEYRADGGLEDSVACYLRKPWSELQLTNALENARESYRMRRSSAMPPYSPAYAVLLVEDDPHDARELVSQLELGGVCNDIKHCTTVAHAVSLMRNRQFDAVLLGGDLLGSEARTAIEQLHAAAPEAALLVLGHKEHESENVLAVRSGAQDYLIKGHTDAELLRRALQHGIERKHQERKLAYLAHHDPLTQLANRTAFAERLEACMNACRQGGARCAVMFLDLDGFKQVNDTHGHDAGDTVLCEIGRRIQASVREEDLVARLGGDEFGVLLAELDHVAIAARVAQRILDITNMPVLLRDEVEVCVQSSVGIALYPDSGDAPDILLRAADAAMYEAKAKGGGYLLHVTAPEVDVKKRPG